MLLTENVDGEIEECRTFYRRESANDMLQMWAEENSISLDPDESDVYMIEDEADGEEYIINVSDPNIGMCRIITSELED